MPSTHAFHCRLVQALGEDILELERCGDSYEQHVAILDDIMREGLLDVNVLGWARSRPPMMLVPHSMLAGGSAAGVDVLYLRI